MRTKLWGPDNKLQDERMKDLTDREVGARWLGPLDSHHQMDIATGPGQWVHEDPDTTQSPDTEIDPVATVGAEISIVSAPDRVRQLGDREASQRTVLSTDRE